MKRALVGSRYFAATVFEALRKEEGIESPASSRRPLMTGWRWPRVPPGCARMCSTTRRS